MKDTTLEGRAKTKNGVTRLVFSVVCILLEVIFVLLLFTGLNRYAEAINLCTRILGLIVILNMYDRSFCRKGSCRAYPERKGVSGKRGDVT